MEPLSTTELAGLKAWMADKGLSQEAAAEILGVSDTAIIGWKKGGKVRPTAHDKLLAVITPYLKPDQFVDADKMVPAEIRPSLRPIYAKLCELEDAGDTVALPVIRHLSMTWQAPAVIKDPLTTAPALTLRPKTTPPELKYIRPLDDIPVMPAAAGTGREGAAFAMNAGKAQVIGESMEPEYQHGEIVKLEPLAEVVIMNDEGFIDFAAVAKVIKSGGDYLLSLNDSGNTIKRIRLETPGPSGRWALNLVALNRDWADANGYDKGERMIRRGDSLVIYARVRK